ncbi:hypothetical protein [Chryseobacterium phocaeense]|uniref:hypothetical protein n=1 Tax=Chryseobacterium phocaeense TaxID=1816690 RepID=UPI001E4B47EA|nr:hypothetical protein [Chryseobacterium phocaeense]
MKDIILILTIINQILMENQELELELLEGFNSVELEERLEMVNLTVLAGEAAAASLLCDFGSVEVSAPAQ